MEVTLEFVSRDLTFPQGHFPCVQPGSLPLFGQCLLSLLKTDGDGSVLVLPLSPHCFLLWCKTLPLCKVPSVESLLQPGAQAFAGRSREPCLASPSLPQPQAASTPPRASLAPAVPLCAASCPSCSGRFS